MTVEQTSKKNKGLYLHPEEGDTGEEVHCGLEVLQPIRAAGWEVVLHLDQEKISEPAAQMISNPSLSSVVFVSMGNIQHTVAQSPIPSNPSTCYCVGVQCLMNVSLHVTEELSL